MRLDSSDKQVLAAWGIRFAAAFIAVISTALTLALAARLFFVVSGL